MCCYRKLLCLAFVTVALLHSAVARAWSSTTRNYSSIPAVIVFGDSTVDPGNNDFYKTIFKSNFAPYGVDFDKSNSTGRFTNGRLPTDFVASYLGIKPYIPPYLDPSLSLRDLMTGVSFASAGSGYDPLTSTTNGVISMSKQLEYFEEYKARLIRSIGMKRAMYIIKKAVYVISCGTNDFTQSRPLAQNDHVYQLYILKLTDQFIQMDKASIIKDAIDYIQELQAEERRIQLEISEIESGTLIGSDERFIFNRQHRYNKAFPLKKKRSASSDQLYHHCSGACPVQDIEVKTLQIFK